MNDEQSPIKPDDKPAADGPGAVVVLQPKMSLKAKVTRADGRVEHYRVNPDGTLTTEEEPANG